MKVFVSKKDLDKVLDFFQENKADKETFKAFASLMSCVGVEE
jgi:hypothetical protein